MPKYSFTKPVSVSAPCQSHITICHRLAGYDFPWELNRALELAVLRTFCVPRIAQLLHQTGEFERRPQKRYDNTGLILSNIMKWGYDSPQGQAAIAAMNRVHRCYLICNEDFLYVLSVLIYEPIRWNQHYGWRLFTEREKLALFEFWQVVGHRMNIANIPPTFTAFEEFNQAYEAQNFRYSPANRAVGDAVVALMQSWFPTILAPLIPTIIRALVDKPMRAALGWPEPTPKVRWCICQALRWSRHGVGWLPRRRYPHFLVDTPNTTYPEGYRLAALEANGTEPSLPVSHCPFLRMQTLFKART